MQVEIRYRPHDRSTGSRQIDFHMDRYRVQNRAVYAGTGGGKTYMAAWDWIMLHLENDGYRSMAFEPDYAMLERNMFTTFRDLLGVRDLKEWPLTRRFVTSPKPIWELINGSTMYFAGLEDPEKAEGPNLDGAWIDEARIVRKLSGPTGAMMTIRRRLRGSGRGHPRTLIITTHSPTKYLADLFEGPDAMPNSRVYRWSTHAALAAGTLPADYIDVVKAHHGTSYEAVIEGHYARPSGLVYSEFKPATMVRADPPFSPEVMTYGVDWGWTDPTCLTAWAWAGSSVHGVEEWYHPHRRIGEIVEAAHEMEARHGEGVWWCGPDKPEHIEAFRDEGLDARPYKGRIDDGVDWIRQMMHGDEFTVSPRMKNWLREVDEYLLDDETGKPDPDASDNHAMDSGRYGVMGKRQTRYASA